MMPVFGLFTSIFIRLCALAMVINESLFVDDPRPEAMCVAAVVLILPTIGNVMIKKSEKQQLAPGSSRPGVKSDVLSQLEHRYKINDFSVDTDWDKYEAEVERYYFNGDPDIHVHLGRVYPYSVEECQVHRFPMAVQDSISVVYQNEPHAACYGCGKILSIDPGRRRNQFVIEGNTLTDEEFLIDQISAPIRLYR